MTDSTYTFLSLNSATDEGAGLMVLFFYLAVLATCYFLGCFNGAVIVSKYILKDDVRNHGSGNAGLTNFYRTFGGFLTFLVILTDMLKGVFSILLATTVTKALGGEAYLVCIEYLAAIACMLGHMFPITFNFKGGKGVLTGGAIIFMIDMRIALIVWLGFILLVFCTRYVSLGSCSSGVTFMLANAYFYPDALTIALGVCIGSLLLWGHRTNIVRLVKGEENRFSFRRKKAS